MKYAKIVVIAGVLVVLFGAIFQFQGRGQIGPEPSFMYQNKKWVDYGYAIIACGAAIIVIGTYLRNKKF
jgi:hypothetical protein